MIHQIYILVIIVMTAAIIIYYYIQESKHQKELDKINKLETINKKNNQQLEDIRLKTNPCPLGEFSDPRSCYFDSNYACVWNEQAKRCDTK